MAKGCKKCDPHDLCEECPEWIFTLADLIMCMMGLFVILWVLKPSATPKPGSTEEQRQTEVIAGIRDGFGYEPNPNSNDPIDQWMLHHPVMNGEGEKGRSRSQTTGAEGTDPEVTSVRRGSQAIVGGRVMFPQGSAEIDREAIVALDQIALQVRGHRNIVEVKGHTSLEDLPQSATPQQKMSLSVARAVNVQDYLISKGVSPEILRVNGCSTFEPLQQRAYTTAAQSLNRRVEVEVSSTLVEELQDHAAKAPTTITTPNRPAAGADPVQAPAHE